MFISLICILIQQKTKISLMAIKVNKVVDHDF